VQMLTLNSTFLHICPLLLNSPVGPRATQPIFFISPPSLIVITIYGK
jgi:hypothetical protein